MEGILTMLLVLLVNCSDCSNLSEEKMNLIWHGKIQTQLFLYNSKIFQLCVFKFYL